MKKQKPASVATAKPSPAFLKHQRNMRNLLLRLEASVLTRSDITQLRVEVGALREELRELHDAIQPLVDAGWLKKWSQKMQTSIVAGTNGEPKLTWEKKQ